MYEQVAHAYINALKARSARGESVRNIASVASFFVSRVDAIVEKTFDELVKAGKAKTEDKNSFFGKIGIANSKVAYASFEKLFTSNEFKALKEQGARVQRPLWASTGTKNPVFKSVMYVEELAGRDTVNTMPPATVKALLADGVIEPRLHGGAADAVALVNKVNALGVPFSALLQELQVAGVKSFSDSYRDLLQSIDNKRKSI